MAGCGILGQPTTAPTRRMSTELEGLPPETLQLSQGLDLPVVLHTARAHRLWQIVQFSSREERSASRRDGRMVGLLGHSTSGAVVVRGATEGEMTLQRYDWAYFLATQLYHSWGKPTEGDCYVWAFVFQCIFPDATVSVSRGAPRYPRPRCPRERTAR